MTANEFCKNKGRSKKMNESRLSSLDFLSGENVWRVKSSEKKILLNSKLIFSEEVKEGSGMGDAPHSRGQKVCLNRAHLCC